MGICTTKKKPLQTEHIDKDTEKLTSTLTEKRPVDRSKLIISEKESEELIYKPGQIDGNMMVFRKLRNCKVVLLDYSATITVEDCDGCLFFIGPCKSSVNFRRCKALRIMSISQQLRMTDCIDCKIALYCMSRPTIETCTNCSFGCLYFEYNELKAMMESAGLIAWNNKWSEVHDFERYDFGYFNAIKDEDFRDEFNELINGDVVDFNKYTVLYSIGQSENTENYEKCIVFAERDLEGLLQEVFEPFALEERNCLLMNTILFDKGHSQYKKLKEKHTIGEKNYIALGLAAVTKENIRQIEASLLVYVQNGKVKILKNADDYAAIFIDESS